MKVRRCPHCGKQVPLRAVLCMYCGGKFEMLPDDPRRFPPQQREEVLNNKCPMCGMENKPRATICQRCKTDMPARRVSAGVKGKSADTSTPEVAAKYGVEDAKPEKPASLGLLGCLIPFPLNLLVMAVMAGLGNDSDVPSTLKTVLIIVLIVVGCIFLFLLKTADWEELSEEKDLFAVPHRITIQTQVPEEPFLLELRRPDVA